MVQLRKIVANFVAFIFSISMRILICCLLFPVILFLQEGASAQNVMINEFMSSNNETVADEDGDYADWIEIYNAGPGQAQLEGWGLSDNAGNPYKWIFPEVTLDSGKYLLVWASGKNRRFDEGERTNGVMREVYRMITGSNVESLTQHVSYPGKPTYRRMVRDFFEAPVNMDDNYGQRMQCFFKPPATGYYIFWIACDDKGQLWFSGDETTANLQKIAEVPGWTFSREFSKYPQQQSAPVYLEKGKFYYMMALSKEGNGGDNLAMGWLGPDDSSEIPASCRNLYWWAEQLHTGFNISAGGETLVLTNPQGMKVDEMLPVSIPTDFSYGRTPEDIKKTGFFTRPTPGQSNNPASYDEILPPPEFSQPGGFYGNPFSLTLTSSKPGVSIVYTLDGSEPDINNLTGTTYQYKNQYPAGPGSQTGGFLYRSFRSNLYTSSLEIKDRSGEANQVSAISSTYDANPNYFPSFPVDKAVVVKARTVKERALSSEVVTHSYFIKKGGINPYPLPLVSFSAQEDELFNYSKGIYVAGTDFDLWRASNPNTSADGGVPANYHRDGDFWEYPASMELFETSGKRVLGQNIGFRIHGDWSRAHRFKSLRIYARSEYGKPELEYPFFPGRDGDSYKRIILRNSGNDVQYTLFRDAAMQVMVSHLNFETMAYQPAILFLNGEYWGIHNIRERFDKYYLASRFGINEDQLDILEDNSTVIEGDAQHYSETMEYIALNGVQTKENYEYVKKRIDISSFIDYMLAEIFIVNTDWPGNNIKYWRLKTPDYLPGEGSGKDGRWRWMMFDTDFGFGLYTSTDYMRNMMAFTTATNGPDWPNPPWSTFLFRKLLENPAFRTGFIVRFCDQLNTALKPTMLKAVIDDIQAAVEPEMTRHIQRWKIPSGLASWRSNVNVMRSFAEQRPFHAWSHIRQFFNITSEYNLTVDVSDPAHGHVVVNTIPLVKATRGVPENPYPWQGRYFARVPLRLEAVPDSGYEFVRWQRGTSFFDLPVLEINPEGNQDYLAVFRKSGQTDDVHDIHVSQHTGPTYPEMQAFPNPFREYSILAYDLVRPEMVKIILYTMTGRKLSETDRGMEPAGINYFKIGGTSLQPGVYLVVCETESTIFQKKLVKY